MLKCFEPKMLINKSSYARMREKAIYVLRGRHITERNENSRKDNKVGEIGKRTRN